MTPHRLGPDSRHAPRGDEGATALEYILVLGLVGLLVLALTSAGIAGRAGPTIATAVCRLFSLDNVGACGAPAATGAPTAPCVRSSTGATVALEVNVMFVDLGTGEGFVLEELSDGRRRVNWVQQSELGVTAALVQGEGTVRVGGREFGLGADVSASGASTWEEGDSRTFASEEAAVDYIVDRGIDEGIEALPHGPRQIAQAGRPVVDWVIGNDRDDGENLTEAAQTGVRVEAELSGTAGPLSGELAGAAQGAVRVTRTEQGERRVVLILSTERSAGLGIPVLAEAGASASGEYRVEFTVDANGEFTRLKVSVITQGAVEVSALRGRESPEQVLREVGASITGSEQDRTLTEYTLQLDTPELRGAAQTFLRDVPRAGGALLQGDSAQLEQAARELWSDGLGPATTITVREYRDEELGAGLAAKLRVLGVGGGGAADVSILSSRLQDAVYWDTTNGGFVPDTACTG